MNDEEEPRPKRESPPDPEGVRIIGPDEAERVLEREDVARRRGPDDPRPGDRPGGPPEDAPEPVLRFPLSSGEGEEQPPELPHWSEPPTGEFSVGEASLFDEDADVGSESEWSAFTSSAPRWRDGDDQWSEDEDVRVFGDDDTRIGALDDSDRPDPEDFFRFDELDERQTARSVFADTPGGTPGAAPADHDADDDLYDEGAADYGDEGSRKIVVGGGRVRPGRPDPVQAPAAGIGGDRNITQAAVVGVALIVLAAVLFYMGPAWAALLVVPVVTLAAAEFFAKLREVGYQPAALLGIAASAGMVIGTYHRGEAAIPVALVLVTVFSMLWFLLGAGEGQATLNIGVTLLGVAWIGMFGSFATALLAVQGGEGVGDAGKGILFGAIIATVGYDLGGYFVGRSGSGRSPLSAASPNKTVEGLLGGIVAAVTVALIYGFLSEPFGGLGDALALGVTVAVAAPLGDLCQSMIKRDLGIKDMSSVLPGHGGLTDRFDGLLFVLPAIYYVAKLADFFV
jgi:phosphatidate cytidylyltransferase